MQSLLTGQDKIMEKLKSNLIEKETDLQKHLEEGDFMKFEQAVKGEIDEMSKSLMQSMLNNAAEDKSMQLKAKQIGEKKKLKIRKTKVSIYIWTGQKIEITSYYGSPKPNYTKKKKGRRRKSGPNGRGGHVLLWHWGFLGKYSPSCYSHVALLTVVCPSFDLALKVLEEQGVNLNIKTVRHISLLLGKKSKKYRVLMNVGDGESLAGKRIIISTDGGRTRIRVKKEGAENQTNKRSKFDTPWKEPKVLVIQQIGQDGQISKKSLPIYDTVLGSANAIFKLLAEYLERLQIKGADKVLFIGDGAKWIWKRTKGLLEGGGLKPSQYIEAIDYYHAVQHLYKTIGQLPEKNLVDLDKAALTKELKNLLWNGDITALVKRIKQLGKGNLPKINSLLNFYAKQTNLFRYSYLREIKMPCGSGIVESAVRRIINLRFKAPSSFWLPDNVEPLMFLRGIALAGRWSSFIRNFANLQQG